MLFLHGGVYRSGSAFGYRPLAGALAAAAERSVLLPDYRLAPEHPYPAALDDALRAYLWLVDRGTDPQRITVAGDSSGAHLALSLLLALRQRGLPAPGRAALLCPGLDLAGRFRTEPDDAAEPGDPIGALLCRRFVEEYLCGHPADDPLVSPLTADLTGLPPLLVQAATGDPYRPDAHRLADRARDHGVDVRFELYPVDHHTFQIFWTFLPEAAEALDRAGRFIREERERRPLPPR
ncbi:alpha/beta hydrolase [Yinghuangia sp. KLBMP8922]|uniref:Alpha/beta hydrolase n=1 Tax=Yinghuangia soli TaxID=2908204 RepID=A0AA41U4Y1_9ACTN|nr:alpha/beta hydrolase [Yinghuangia soli]